VLDADRVQVDGNHHGWQKASTLLRVRLTADAVSTVAMRRKIWYSLARYTSRIYPSPFPPYVDPQDPAVPAEPYRTLYLTSGVSDDSVPSKYYNYYYHHYYSLEVVKVM
jgi:hypothetical protein